MRRFEQDPIGFLQQLAAAGDVVPFMLGRQRAFLLNHPAFVEDVLVTQSEAFAKGPAYQRARRLLGNGLLTAEGAAHRRGRQVLSPAFHRASLDRSAEVMIARARLASGRWHPNDAIDIVHEMHRLTLSIVGEALFGVELDDRAGEVRAALEAAVASLDPLMSLLAPIRRMRPARARLRAIVDEVIEERLRTRGTGRDPNDLLSLLLAAHEADEDPSLEQLQDDVLTMLLAGHDTMANALSWTWMLLARHPQVERRLHQELGDVLGGRGPAPGDVARLPFTRAVVAESLRLFPPAWTLARRALADYRAGDAVVPAGSLVVISQYLLHRDARFFPEPLAFTPARWLADDALRPRLSYFPFGAGPRSCIGEGFAWMEGVLLVATLAQQWQLRSATDAPFEIEPRVTLRIKPPALMRAEARRHEVPSARG